MSDSERLLNGDNGTPGAEVVRRSPSDAAAGTHVASRGTAWCAVLAVDLSGRIIYVNGAAEAMHGGSRDDLFGRPLSSLCWDSESEACGESRSPTDAPRSLTAMTCQASPIRDRDGKVTGAVLAFSRAASDELPNGLAD